MDEQITLDEVYRMLGERDVLIFRLQKELTRFRQMENADQRAETRRFGNGEADTREALQP